MERVIKDMMSLTKMEKNGNEYAQAQYEIDHDL